LHDRGNGITTSESIYQSNNGEVAGGDLEFTFDLTSDTSNVTLVFQAHGATAVASTINLQGRSFRITLYYHPTVDNSELILPNTGSPIGTVIMYPLDTCPSGHLIMNGDAVSRTTYAGLFGVLSTTYGIGDGSTTFNTPDMRGRFARMTDLGANRDVDKASRVACQTGGPTGDTTGACQDDTFQGHRHDAPPTGANAGGGAGTVTNYNNANSVTMILDPITDGVNGTPRTGLETRPLNMNMNFCIKY